MQNHDLEGTSSMTTREEELIQILNYVAAELPEPDWVALVDNNGLMVASIPEQPIIEAERISAMTAASVMMGIRVLKEIDGGELRFASIAGSDRQHLTVVLSHDRLLSIGLGPEVPAQATFVPLRRWVPELLRVLRRRFSDSS